MTNKKSKLFLIPAIGALVLAFLMGGALISVIQFTPSNLSIAQLGTESIPFQVIGSSGGVIGSGSNGQWRDSSHEYPAVQVWASQPYLSDRIGTPAGNTQTLTPVDPAIITPDGQVIYHDVTYVTVGVASRTFENFPDFANPVIPVSPYTGTTWNVLGASHTWTSAETSGVLAFIGNVASPTSWNVLPNPVSRFSITQSLVDVSFDYGSGPANPAKSFNNVMSDLRTKSGNRMVTIVPTVPVQALTQFIQILPYTYDVTLANGTVKKPPMPWAFMPLAWCASS